MPEVLQKEGALHPSALGGRCLRGEARGLRWGPGSRAEPLEGRAYRDHHQVVRLGSLLALSALELETVGCKRLDLGSHLGRRGHVPWPPVKWGTTASPQGNRPTPHSIPTPPSYPQHTHLLASPDHLRPAKERAIQSPTPPAQVTVRLTAHTPAEMAAPNAAQREPALRREGPRDSSELPPHPRSSEATIRSTGQVSTARDRAFFLETPRKVT